jgi:predicted TIM-barrel fold metal-dependent hydrolase
MIDSHVILGSEHHLSLDVDELLRRMDAHGVETAIARPAGAELAVYNRAGNDRVLKAHRRVRGMATANPWFGAKAIEELNRCRDLGAVSLFFHPSRQGFMPTDDILRPILDWNLDTRWPVVFHTGSYVQSDILAVAEVARRYPQTNFVAGFGGFSDMWFELAGALRDVPQPLHRHRDDLGRSDPPDRPRERRRTHPVRQRRTAQSLPVVIDLLKRLDLSEEQMRAICDGNARKLFGFSSGPSPLYSGRGRVRAHSWRRSAQRRTPHPSSPPEYRERRKKAQERTRFKLTRASRILDLHTHLASHWFRTPLLTEREFLEGLDRCGVETACIFTMMGFYGDCPRENDKLADYARGTPSA